MPNHLFKSHFFAWWLVLSLTISDCSIEISQSTVTASPTSNDPAVQTARALMPWAKLNLSGKLVYNTSNSTVGTVGVQSLDLETGDRFTIFQAPGDGWVYEVAVSPDHTTLVLTYSPPMNAAYGGQGTLYQMPLDASEPPQLLFPPPTSKDQFSQPAWSPDGKYIYFSHINFESMENPEIMRMAYPDGKPEKLIGNAYWPRLSDDGSQLVYVALDPQSGENYLFIANSDGTAPQQVRLRRLPVSFIIDAPMFSPDNQFIVFSSPIGSRASAPNWVDKLLGVTVARADGTLPSDWWRVAASGGKAIQLTHVQSLALFGTFSPDRKYIASCSLDGIFVMKPDGSEVSMVVNDTGGISGTVSWIP
jgi:Tol biopolymer transport system component